MIKSPTCNHDKIKITDTRTVSYRGQNRRKRWRKCLICDQRDTTIEMPTHELEIMYNEYMIDGVVKLRALCEETLQSLGDVNG